MKKYLVFFALLIGCTSNSVSPNSSAPLKVPATFVGTMKYGNEDTIIYSGGVSITVTEADSAFVCTMYDSLQMKVSLFPPNGKEIDPLTYKVENGVGYEGTLTFNSDKTQFSVTQNWAGLFLKKPGKRYITVRKL